MSSLLRRIQRKRLRDRGKYESAPAAFRFHRGNGHDTLRGYDALHPTKGWKRISAARLRAQLRLAAMVERTTKKVA